jgi:phytanoyl-CoA hydroxylase
MSQRADAVSPAADPPAGPTFDAEAGGDQYAPDLYRPDVIMEPLTSVAEACTERAREHWISHGWLSVRGVLDDDDVADAKAAIDDLVAGRVAGFDGLMYERSVEESFDAMSAEERRNAVRKLWSFCRCDARMDRIAGDAGIHEVLNGIFGGGKVRLFQDMALLKPPFLGREKPWHQDHAFFDFPLGTRIVGVWIALDPATLANGCMQVIDGGHREGPRNHFRRRDWQICDSEMLGRRSVAFPLAPGDALFFDGLIPHGTPANRTADRRRALQFHYCPADALEAAKDSRLAIFGGEGKGATC